MCNNIHKFKNLQYYTKLPKSIIYILIKKSINTYLSFVIKNINMEKSCLVLPIGNVIIRQAKEDDLLNIYDIFNKSFTYLSLKETKIYTNEIKKNIYKYHSINIVGEYNKKCIGFIIAKPEVTFFRNQLKISIHITWMALDPSYRTYKISAKMLEYLIDIMKKMKKIEKIISHTNVSNIPAIKIYEKLGFEKTRIIPEFMLKENGIEFEKKLKP